MTNRVLDPDELVAQLREYDDLIKALRHDADLCRRFSQQTWPICGQAADLIAELKGRIAKAIDIGADGGRPADEYLMGEVLAALETSDVGDGR